jgi:predicted transcriptional regulator
MERNEHQMVRQRTDFPSAVQQVIEVLSDGRPYTLNKLAQESNLNFRTVKKAVELIERTQTTLKSKRVEVSATSENHTVVQAREKSGFASLPEDVRRMVIKAIYPSVTEEEKILAGLLRRGAISEKTAVAIPEEPALLRLVEAEHVNKAKGEAKRYYLTNDGQMIAKGALQLYPELQEL